MNTAFLLMAQFDGKTVIPLSLVCREFFTHLTPEKFLAKALAGQITLPVIHLEKSRKSAKGVHLNDLAAYLDERRAAAVKERDQLRRDLL